MDDQKNSGLNKNSIALVIVFIILVAGLAVWYLNKKAIPEENLSISDISVTTEGTSTLPFEVNWISNTYQSPYKKFSILIPHDATSSHVSFSLYKIGTIGTGQYKDNSIVLAQCSSDWDGGAGYNPPYGYYIYDSAGKAVAWFGKEYAPIDSTNGADCNEYTVEKNIGGGDLLPVIDPHNFPFDPSKSYEILSKNNLFTVDNYLDFYTPTSTDRIVNGIFSTNSLWKMVFRQAQYVALYREFSGVIYSYDNYALVTPFNTYYGVTLLPDFVQEGNPPDLRWNIGDKEVVTYKYGQYGYGWEDCFKDLLVEQFKSYLIRTGTTKNNQPLYEIDPQMAPSSYQCLYKEASQYRYDSGGSTYQPNITYEQFIQSHPLFFWKHPFGPYITFVREDVVPAAEKGKPVIYLYPERKTNVNVQVMPEGGFTKTVPEYEKGWNVTASPDGILTNSVDNKTYRYLYWEGGKDGIVKTPEQGFVIAKDKMGSELNEKLTELGLNNTERKDFLEFWLPKLSKSPYYFITFISRSEIDRTAPLNIHPRPDTIIRILMDYKPLASPVSVEPLELKSTERKGFTVVEWGGILRD